MTDSQITEMDRALDTGVRETLENMLFVEPEPPEEPQELFELCAAVDAQAPVPCRMTFSMDRSLAAQFAEELYSVETGDVTEALMMDIAKELLNTIAGVALAEVSDAAPIRLGIPFSCAAEHTLLDARVAKHYTVEEGQVLVTVEQLPAG